MSSKLTKKHINNILTFSNSKWEFIEKEFNQLDVDKFNLIWHRLNFSELPFKKLSADKLIISLISHIDFDQFQSIPSITGLKGYITNKTEISKADKKCILIGHQAHLNRTNTLGYHDWSLKCSLGNIRNQTQMVKAVLHSLDVLFINLDVLRLSDYPYNKSCYPTGLYIEELCQLLHYAGSSPDLKYIHFINIPTEIAENNYTGRLVATLLWYYCEGVLNKMTIPQLNSPNIKKYVVETSPEYNATFLLDEGNNWWLKDKIGKLWPVSLEEYTLTVNKQMPERISTILI